MTIHARAARQLAEAWREHRKLSALTSDLKPASLADGYGIQAALGERLQQSVVGWKIAATSSQGQQHIGVDEPLAGRLFTKQVRQDGDHLSMAGNQMAVAECEFVFCLGADLPAQTTPYSRHEVLAAVATLHPGLELPDSRFDDFATAGAACLAADNACAHWMLIGPATTEPWRDGDLANHRTTLWINGNAVTQGSGADVLGHPLEALTWLANNHTLQGDSLRRGQYITTGVTGQPSPIQAGDTVRAELGALGSVTVHLTA